jgi:hypothetical protein
MSKKAASRSFDLSNEEIKTLAEQYAKDKEFPNPYRAGAYHHTITAIVKLGVNKPHPVAKVHEAFKRVAGAEWYGEWAKKESRNDKTGKDADGRFLQNLKVLQRTKDYGRKLLQAGRRILKTKGCVIDLARDARVGILVSLNTRSEKPQKLGRANSKEVVATKRKPKTATKRRNKATQPPAEPVEAGSRPSDDAPAAE